MDGFFCFVCVLEKWRLVFYNKQSLRIIKKCFISNMVYCAKYILKHLVIRKVQKVIHFRMILLRIQLNKRNFLGLKLLKLPWSTLYYYFLYHHRAFFLRIVLFTLFFFTSHTSLLVFLLLIFSIFGWRPKN